METPISPSEIKPIPPDNRPMYELLISTINAAVSQNPTREVISIGLESLSYDMDLLKCICIKYEEAGWGACYVYKYMTLFGRYKLVMHKSPIHKLCYYIDHDTKEVHSKPFEHYVDVFHYTDIETAKQVLTYHFPAKSIDEEPKQSWLDKLFS